MEHLEPQQARPDRATDYQNMVLCFPENGPCDFGAIAKGDANVDETNFVSPLNEGCQRRLRYRFSGKVAPAEEEDEPAARTIALLALNPPEPRQRPTGRYPRPGNCLQPWAVDLAASRRDLRG